MHEDELSSEGKKAAGCGTPRRNGRAVDRLWLERCHGLDVIFRGGGLLLYFVFENSNDYLLSASVSPLSRSTSNEFMNLWDYFCYNIMIIIIIVHIGGMVNVGVWSGGMQMLGRGGRERTTTINEKIR